MKDELRKMLPFLGTAEIDMVAKNVLESEAEEWKGFRLNDLFPFMSTAVIDKMFLETVDAGKDYTRFLPFISGRAMHEIVEDVIAGKRELSLDQMYPFMSNEDMKRVFYYYLDKEE